MTLRIDNRQRQVGIDRRSVGRLVDLILDDQGRCGADLAVVFARDALVRELNASYRDVDAPTDVLAFATCDGPEPGGAPGELETELGDVVISVDRAAEQARRYRKTVESELLKLVAHGVLHLLGHDHETSGERTRMRNLENRYLRILSRTA